MLSTSLTKVLNCILKSSKLSVESTLLAFIEASTFVTSEIRLFNSILNFSRLLVLVILLAVTVAIIEYPLIVSKDFLSHAFLI